MLDIGHQLSVHFLFSVVYCSQYILLQYSSKMVRAIKLIPLWKSWQMHCTTRNSVKKSDGKISVQPHTIVKQICFPKGNVLFLSLFSLSKNWMDNLGWAVRKFYQNECSDKRFSLTQDSFERGFVRQQLNFNLRLINRP